MRRDGGRTGPREAGSRACRPLSGCRDEACLPRAARGARGRQEAQAQARRARAARQPRARPARVPGDAARLLPARLGPLQGRTVLLPLAVLAGPRRHGQHGQRAGDREDPIAAHVLREGSQNAARRSRQLLRQRELRRARRHVHEHAAGVRRDRGAADRPRRGEVLRRQRLGRDRADAGLPPDARTRGSGRGRSRDGLRDGRLAGITQPRLPRGHPVQQPRRKHRPQHDHDRPGRRARGPALQSDEEPGVPELRRAGLRMGPPLSGCSRGTCTPITSTAAASSNPTSTATPRA